MDADKLITVLDMIAEDTVKDVEEFNGKAFKGSVVAEYFAKQGAAIATLAKIVKEIIEDLHKAPSICAPQDAAKLFEYWDKVKKSLEDIGRDDVFKVSYANAWNVKQYGELKYLNPFACCYHEFEPDPERPDTHDVCKICGYAAKKG